MATNEREHSDPLMMGLLKDRSLGASLRKFGSLPLSQPLQKILSFACSHRRLLGRGPDNERWDTLKRSKTGQRSPAMRIAYLLGETFKLGDMIESSCSSRRELRYHWLL